MNYVVEVYWASYASIDPNVVQDYYELNNGHHLILPSDNDLVESKIIARYATLTTVKMPIYDFEFIKQKYTFSQIPHIVDETKYGVIFKDDLKARFVPHYELKEFVNLETRDVYVLRWEKEKYYDSETLCEGLYSELNLSSGIAPRPRQILQLNRQQIQFICNNTHYAEKLLDLYEKDNDSIYVRFFPVSYD